MLAQEQLDPSPVLRGRLFPERPDDALGIRSNQLIPLLHIPGPHQHFREQCRVILRDLGQLQAFGDSLPVRRGATIDATRSGHDGLEGVQHLHDQRVAQPRPVGPRRELEQHVAETLQGGDADVAVRRDLEELGEHLDGRLERDEVGVVQQLRQVLDRRDLDQRLGRRVLSGLRLAHFHERLLLELLADAPRQTEKDILRVLGRQALQVPAGQELPVPGARVGALQDCLEYQLVRQLWVVGFGQFQQGLVRERFQHPVFLLPVL
ncbi:transporter MCH4 [Apiospora arundinis]